MYRNPLPVSVQLYAFGSYVSDIIKLTVLWIVRECDSALPAIAIHRHKTIHIVKGYT